MLNAFAAFLVGRDDAVVMNVSSGLAFVPLPITPTYSATKAGRSTPSRRACASSSRTRPSRSSS